MDGISKDLDELILTSHKNEKAALESILEHLYQNRENVVRAIILHAEFKTITKRLFHLLGCQADRSAGNAAYILGVLADKVEGLECISQFLINGNQFQSVFADIVNLLESIDNEAAMNTAGALAAFLEHKDGLKWLFKQRDIPKFIYLLSELSVGNNLQLANNASLVLARLTVIESGCKLILNHKKWSSILKHLFSILSKNVSGPCQNAAFCIGRLFEIKLGFDRFNELKLANKIVVHLHQMLNNTRLPFSKSACFALTCMNTKEVGHHLVLKRIESGVMLLKAVDLIHSEDQELAHLAALLFQSFSSHTFGNLLIRRAPKLLKRIKSLKSITKPTDLLYADLEAIIKLYQPPSAPSNLHVKVLSPFEITASWDPVQFKTLLPLEYKLINVDDSQSFYEGTKASIHLQDLHPFYSYSFGVKATTQCDEGPVSNIVHIQMPESKPTVPLELRLIGIEFEQVHLNWAPPAYPNGVLLGYSIMQNEQVIEKTLDQSCIVIGLQHGTLYTLQVCAYTSVGNGPSAEIEFETPLKKTILGAIKFNIQGRNQVLVQWDNPEQVAGKFVKFELLVNNKSLYNGLERRKLIENLLPDKEYTFQLVLHTTEGKSYSEKITKKTPKHGYEYVQSTAPYYFAKNIESHSTRRSTKPKESTIIRNQKIPKIYATHTIDDRGRKPKRTGKVDFVESNRDKFRKRKTCREQSNGSISSSETSIDDSESKENLIELKNDADYNELNDTGSVDNLKYDLNECLRIEDDDVNDKSPEYNKDATSMDTVLPDHENIAKSYEDDNMSFTNIYHSKPMKEFKERPKSSILSTNLTKMDCPEYIEDFPHVFSEISERNSIQENPIPSAVNHIDSFQNICDYKVGFKFSRHRRRASYSATLRNKHPSSRSKVSIFNSRYPIAKKQQHVQDMSQYIPNKEFQDDLESVPSKTLLPHLYIHDDSFDLFHWSHQRKVSITDLATSNENFVSTSEGLNHKKKFFHPTQIRTQPVNLPHGFIRKSKSPNDFRGYYLQELK